MKRNFITINMGLSMLSSYIAVKAMKAITGDER